MNRGHFQEFILTILFFLIVGIAFGQWQPLNAPEGGYVRSIISDGSIVLAATGGGVLLSENQGSSWEFRNEGLTSCDTKSFTKLAKHFFVSTDENVFRTNDFGLSWEAAGMELNGIYTKNLTVCNNVLFAATYLRGIYCSSDTGNTWAVINNGFSAKYAYYLATDSSNIYAGTYQDGMYRSADMGNSWESINSGLPELNIMAIICFGNKVFASTLSSGVFVSSNHGNNWSPLEASLPSVKGFATLDGVLYSASMGNGVSQSVDTGQTWNAINEGLNEMDLWSIGTSDSELFVGTKAGHIYKRNSSGGNWAISCAIPFDACVGILCSSGSNLLAGTHGSGFFASTNAGDSWTRITSIWTVETRASISSGQYVFAGTDMLGVFKSTNNGASFSMSNTGLTSSWIQAFTICSGKLFAGSGEEGVFISSDAGASWNPINSGLGSLRISSLTSDGENIYAGTSGAGVYILDDLGGNWMAINDGLLTNEISCLHSDSSNLFAGTKNNGLFRSDDQGAAWQQVSNGLSDQADIRCIYHFDTLLFVGTGEGEIFLSTNNGDSWEEITNDLSGSPILSLLVYDDFLYAGLNAGGVWKMPLSLITGINDVEDAFAFQIYPNPSKNFVTIETKIIDENSYFTMYAVTGQKIMSQQVQHNKIKIDIRALKPGIYFVKCGNQNPIRFVKE